MLRIFICIRIYNFVIFIELTAKFSKEADKRESTVDKLSTVEKVFVMSNFKGHIIAGAVTAVAAGCAVFYFRERLGEVNLLGAAAMTCGGALFGSLYPDTDTDSVSGRVICYPLLLAAASLSFYFGLWYIFALSLVMIVVPMLSGHRKWTHTIWFNLLVAVAMGLLAPRYIAAGYFIGVLCHKVVDSKLMKIVISAVVACLAVVVLLFATGFLSGRDLWQSWLSL